MEKTVAPRFPKQRSVILPEIVQQRCRNLPIVRQLHAVDIGILPATAPHHYVDRPDGFEHSHFIYCLDGTGTLVIRNREYDIHTGHCFFIPHGEPHTYFASADNPWSTFWICFSGLEEAATLESLGVDGSPLLFVPDTTRMRSLFESLYACVTSHYGDAGLLAMSSELVRIISYIKMRQGRVDEQLQSTDNCVLETIRFMQHHVDKPLSLNDIVATSGLSVSHYCSLFKKLTGQTPMTFFALIKIQKASDMLIHSDLTIKEISQELGYEDHCYFSRLFKKVQGCPPSRLRERHMNHVKRDDAGVRSTQHHTGDSGSSRSI